MDFVFDKVPLAGKVELIDTLAKIAFVPVQDRNGTISNRSRPRDVIDRNSPIADLYFDDEPVFGSGVYYAGGRYHDDLVRLGMKSQFDAAVAAERIKAYHSREDSSLFIKYQRLLAFLNGPGSVKLENEWLSIIKLPAIKGGQRVVLPPSQCRPKPFIALVQGVLGIVQAHVEEPLAKAFGWDEDIDPDIIGSRILLLAGDFSTDCQHALFPVMEYLAKIESAKLGNYVAQINSKLGTTPWIPGSCNQLYSSRRVFFSHARLYEPYISEIPPIWAAKHERVLTLFNVQNAPGPEMLVEFISSLDTTPLSNETLERVISALELVDNANDSTILEGLKVPDVHGILVPIDEFGKESKVRYAHPRVPQSLAIKFNIPQFENDLAYSQYMNGPDIFEEFTQEESLVRRIANQVKEATLWLSFNEFVANAEDCGSASNVTWVLDSEQTKYPSKKLFCAELDAWQTPGLYVYNNGTFTDSDFEALVNVGMGSKAEDSSKIGKYGLGSLTMYVFTDVPTIISGEYFVMFDPQRQYLPFDLSRKRRKAGLRLKLSQMKTRWADHLMPFIGIGGYNLGMYLPDLTDQI